MKIGFTVSLRNGESIYVQSSDCETWQEALTEVVDFLRRFPDDSVQRFVTWLLKLRIKEDDEENPAKEGE